MRSNIVEVLRTKHKAGLIGPTHGGNPVSCAAGLAVLKYLETHRLVERCATMGELLLGHLQQLADECPWVGNVRGKGLLAGIELVSDRKSRTPFETKLGFARRVGEKALDAGLSVYPGTGTADGVAGEHILLAPPFTITADEIEFIVRTLRNAIQSVASELHLSATGL